MYTLIGPFTQLITLENLPLKGAVAEEDLRIITEGGVLITDDEIMETGRFSDLYKKARSLNAKVTELEGKRVGLPGFVDSHTHLCFAGSRANDYAARNAGKSYLEIAKAGGGIWQTVSQTREAKEVQLAELTLQRLEKQICNGITTTEIKSGYGLNLTDELKMLRVIGEVKKVSPANIVPTCLAAHIKPQDFEGTTSAYLEFVLHELLPTVQKEQLTNRVDIFVEETAFSPEDALSFLNKVKKVGFDITVHADQFTTGGSRVAIACGALSADHLEASTEVEIKALAQSDTVATVLPGASLGLGMPFAPARKLLDAGACLAIASDWNPGSAPMGDLLTQACLLGAYEKLNTAELLAGITFRAAKALGKTRLGRIAKGYKADIIAFETEDVNEIFYHQGQLKPSNCWISGRKINCS